mgnify:CR=1 FL=1
MNLKELQNILVANENANLQIALPSGQLVANHFHITEIGKVHKTFIESINIIFSVKISKHY